MKNNKELSWEEQFDELYFDESKNWWADSSPNEVKEFIRETLATEKKALLDSLEQEFVAASPAFFKEDDKRKGYLLALKVFGEVVNKLKELEKDKS